MITIIKARQNGNKTRKLGKGKNFYIFEYSRTSCIKNLEQTAFLLHPSNNYALGTQARIDEIIKYLRF